MIRPAIQTYRQCSERLISITEQVEEEQRESVIGQIEQLLDVREQLQQQIVQPFTPEEEAAGQELIRLEQEVQASLSRFMKDIRQDITKSQAKKENIHSYVNPYGKMPQDGAYYDTKQ